MCITGRLKLTRLADQGLIHALISQRGAAALAAGGEIPVENLFEVLLPFFRDVRDEHQYLWVGKDDLVERFSGQAQDLTFMDRSHGRCRVGPCEERNFTEEVTFGQARYELLLALVVVSHDINAAGDDQVEPLPLLALFDDGGFVSKALSLESVHQILARFL